MRSPGRWTLLAAVLLAYCVAVASAKELVPVFNKGRGKAPPGMIGKIAKAVEPKLRKIPGLHGPWENTNPRTQYVWKVYDTGLASGQLLSYGHHKSSWSVVLPVWKTVGKRPDQSWAPTKPTTRKMHRGTISITFRLGSDKTWAQCLEHLGGMQSRMNKRRPVTVSMYTMGKAPPWKQTRVTVKYETTLTKMSVLGCPAAALIRTTINKPRTVGSLVDGVRRRQLNALPDKNKEDSIQFWIRYDGFRKPFTIIMGAGNKDGKHVTVDLLEKIAEMLLLEMFKLSYSPETWQGNYVGLELDGAEIPQLGTRNPTLLSERQGEAERYGRRVRVGQWSFIRGKISKFGGPKDTGVRADETPALLVKKKSDEEKPDKVFREFNKPLNADRATISKRPEDFYYIAMRWSYVPKPKTTWWPHQKIVVINPTTGAAVVVRPIDWGPNIATERTMDVSPQTMTDLGLETDQDALVAFVDPATPLGPSQNLKLK